MICGDMVKRVRSQLPPATIESVAESDIIRELNTGINAVNMLTKVYRGYTEFMTVAGQQIYNLSSVAPLCLKIWKPGVWWYNTNGSSKYLFRKTMSWLDISIRNWRDSAAGDPNWYWQESDDLGLYTKPATANTVRIYHLSKGTAMDSLDNYPWKNSTTEVVVFQPLDDAIIAYAKWKFAPAVGKEAIEDPRYMEFIRECRKGKAQINARPDMLADIDYYPRIDGIGQ